MHVGQTGSKLGFYKTSPTPALTRSNGYHHPHAVIGEFHRASPLGGDEQLRAEFTFYAIDLGYQRGLTHTESNGCNGQRWVLGRGREPLQPFASDSTERGSD
jgi:hypothetical protein